MYRGENFFRNKVLTEAIDFFKKFPFLIKSDVILPYRTWREVRWILNNVAPT
jgi:hypothetical protein